jgi:hypothetical protein
MNTQWIFIAWIEWWLRRPDLPSCSVYYCAELLGVPFQLIYVYWFGRWLICLVCRQACNSALPLGSVPISYALHMLGGGGGRGGIATCDYICMGHTDTHTRHVLTHKKWNETLEPEDETNRNWFATYGIHVGSELLTAVTMKGEVFRVVTLCSSEGDRRFGGTRRL